MNRPARIFQYRTHWIAKRDGSAQWYIFWRQPGSRRVHRRTTGSTDLELAKEALVAFVGGRHSARIRAPDWLRLDLAFDKYLAHIRDKASFTTSRAAQAELSTFARRNKIGYVHQFTHEHQQHFIKHRRRQIRSAGHTGSNGTLNRELGVLRAAFKYAKRVGLAVDIPDVRLLPEPSSRETVISAAECKRLLEACEAPHLRLYVLLTLCTLQRNSAVLALRVDQVDLLRNRIDFNRPGRPQTNKRRPVVPIADPLWRDLAIACRKSRSGYVIEYEGQPIASVRTAFRTATARAGHKNVSSDVLRHTSATLLAESGVSMRQISGMMGHTHVRTTERYAKHSPEYLRGAASALTRLYDI